MNFWRRTLGYGLLLWAIPFVVAMGVFPLREMGSPLFETTMAVTLGAATAWLAVLYMRPATEPSWREGLKAGSVWMALSLAIDAALFSWGPMQMTLWGYLSDIGLTYLMMPAIAAAVGHASRRG